MSYARIRTGTSVLVLGAFAAFAGSVALAAESRGPKPSFEALDKDADGKVSVNEAADNDALFVAFKSLDANKDGMLTPQEFAAYQREKPPA